MSDAILEDDPHGLNFTGEYTLDRIELIVRALRACGNWMQACELAGISPVTYRNWRQSRSEFKALTDEAIEHFKRTRLQQPDDILEHVSRALIDTLSGKAMSRTVSTVEEQDPETKRPITRVVKTTVTTSPPSERLLLAFLQPLGERIAQYGSIDVSQVRAQEALTPQRRHLAAQVVEALDDEVNATDFAVLRDLLQRRHDASGNGSGE